MVILNYVGFSNGITFYVSRLFGYFANCLGIFAIIRIILDLEPYKTEVTKIEGIILMNIAAIIYFISLNYFNNKELVTIVESLPWYTLGVTLITDLHLKIFGKLIRPKF